MQSENHYTETDLGNVAPNPRGNFDSTAKYEYLDLVAMQGGSYLCLAELGQTITGIAPEAGKNTEHWQCVAIPGNMTPEYTDAYGKVVRLAREVEKDAAKVAEDKQSVTQMETNARQLKEQAEESARQAENSKDSAAGSAREAKKAEESARQAENNVGTLVNGFDTHVTEKTAEATQAVATAKDNAVQAVERQETASVQEVKDQTATYITEQKNLAKQELDDKVNQFGLDVNVIKAEVSKEGQKQITNVQEATTAELAKITEKGTEQTGLVTAEGNKQVQAVQAAAQEIIADREQINTNKEEVAQLKEDIEQIKSTAYTDIFFKNFFALQRTGKKYTVKFPLWETSQVSTGEKLDDNAGLIIEPSTITEKGRDDYAEIPLFKTYDCNVERINGKLQITAMKGDANYNAEEKDTFVLGMPYYQKTWVQDGYFYLSRSDVQHEGYILCPEAKKTDGMRSFCLYAKYVSGRNSSKTIGSYKGKAPVRNILSHNGCITEGKKRGEEYCFGSSFDIAYIQNTFLIKYADRDWNKRLGGHFAAYENQFLISKPETGVKRVVLAKANAEKFPIGSSVSVGDLGEDTNKGRENVKIHNICDNVNVLDIIEVDVDNKALVLDISENITTTATTWVTSMHWNSGFSDDIIGRDGCPCKTKSQISSMLYPSVIQGIECMVGGYETLGNAFMDIIDGTHRDVYVCDDSTKLTTDINTAKKNYKKLPKQMTVAKNTQWCYGTNIHIDLENGMNIITQAGESGSGSSTGFCDGIYFDNATTGQREFLFLGNLGFGGICGAFCSHCDYGLGAAGWSILAHISLNVYRGEFA